MLYHHHLKTPCAPYHHITPRPLKDSPIKSIKNIMCNLHSFLKTETRSAKSRYSSKSVSQNVTVKLLTNQYDMYGNSHHQRDELLHTTDINIQIFNMPSLLPYSHLTSGHRYPFLSGDRRASCRERV